MCAQKQWLCLVGKKKRLKILSSIIYVVLVFIFSAMFGGDTSSEDGSHEFDIGHEEPKSMKLESVRKHIHPTVQQAITESFVVQFFFSLF